MTPHAKLPGLLRFEAKTQATEAQHPSVATPYLRLIIQGNNRGAVV